MRRHVTIAVFLAAACAADIEPELEETEVATDGSAATGTIPGGGWRTHDVAVSLVGDLVAVLDWTAATNLNLFLYDPSGALVDFSNGTATRPEEVSRDDAGVGTWRLGIKNKSSAATTYTLSVTVTPVMTGYPGQPAPGTLYWGAAISGNGDPVTRHEDPSGYPLALHRTFFQWDRRTSSMIEMARDDHAHDRLPWVSIKTPSWAAMGSGQHDAEIDAMLRALDGLDGPVWLTLHHEPEGGGGINTPDDPAGPSGHLAMNRRVRQRMTALGTDNVALGPILMSYTWTSASGRNPNDWWAADIYDFLGVDHYRDSETTLLDSTWFQIRTWAAARSVDLAVGEWGMRGIDAAAGTRVRAWYDGAAGSHADGRGARVVGLSAFDSNLNSPSGGWELKGEQLRVFRLLLGDPRTAHFE
jgi:hypothetical protein